MCHHLIKQFGLALILVCTGFQPLEATDTQNTLAQDHPLAAMFQHIAWREVELTVKHMAQDDTIDNVWRVSVKAAAGFLTASQWETDPGCTWSTAALQLCEINVCEGPNEANLESYFTTRVGYSPECTPFWDLIRLKWLMAQLIGVAIDNQGKRFFVTPEIDHMLTSIDALQLALYQDAMRLVTRDWEFAPVNQSIASLSGTETLLCLPLDAERIGTFVVEQSEVGEGLSGNQLKLLPVAVTADSNCETDNANSPCVDGQITIWKDSPPSPQCFWEEDYRILTQNSNWSPDRPWRIPGKAEVKLVIHQYAPN